MKITHKNVSEDKVEYNPCKKLNNFYEKNLPCIQNKELKVSSSGHFFKLPTNRGSVTVEASLILPIVVLVAYSFLMFFQILTVQLKLQTALEETVSELAMGEYAVSLLPQGAGKTGDASLKDMLAGAAIKYIEAEVTAELVGELLIEKIGRDWLDSTGIRGGSKGIDFSMSMLSKELDMIDISAEYSYALPIIPGNVISIDLINRSVRRMWTGIDRDEKLPADATTENGNDTSTEDEKTDGNTVYVTKTGSVYHLFKNCQAIRVSVKTCDNKGIVDKRNSGGGKYYPCEFCVRGDSDLIVYYTPDGKRFHNSNSCGSLLRYVEAVSKSSVAGKSLCSYCRKRNATLLDEVA